MPGSVFKIVVDGGDWGSPMANGATFDSLEEAQAEARSYLEQQRRVGASLRVTIEETAPDGTVVKHVVAQPNLAFPCTPNETAAESPRLTLAQSTLGDSLCLRRDRRLALRALPP
jgi:hypothetical protein